MPSRRIKFGSLCFRFQQLDSTMNFCSRLAELGFPQGAAVMAEEQTAGRGTKGRRWHSAAGQGLYVSFLLRPEPKLLNYVSLLAGLAAREAIKLLTAVDIRLKWPNDLVIKGKKLGGILCEGVSSGGKAAVVVGIGINVNHQPEDFPPEIADLATSLAIITGQKQDQEILFAFLGKNLELWYNKLEKGLVSEIIQSFKANLSFSPGQRLMVEEISGKKVEGTFVDLEEKGGIVLRIGQEQKVFYSSEIIKIFS
ncbi:MAG: biotin--[acetyl-CoA-carboxylase] ligase [Candidatus Aminicenantes bacterium]|nr:biotin--[acetyl-CoA-carboxylase] ligase [Candidatus Aminicenantes bacterium]